MAATMGPAAEGVPTTRPTGGAIRSHLLGRDRPMSQTRAFTPGHEGAAENNVID